MNGSPLLYKKSARQVSCRINDEIAILDLDRAIYFGLQGVGVHIWDSLEQPRSVEDLCASVMAEFEVSEATCHADVVQILGKLESEGLIEATEQSLAAGERPIHDGRTDADRRRGHGGMNGRPSDPNS